MKRSLWFAVTGCFACVFALACASNTRGPGFDLPQEGPDSGASNVGASSGGASGSGTGAHDAGAPRGGNTDAASPPFFGDASAPPPGPPANPCTGLQCQAAMCANGTETALTGTVRDPAGALPLYNVYVYVPNTTPDPIVPGNPTCQSCEAPASGHPILGTLTDASGKFTVQKGPNDTWGVPAGSNVPIVLQAGKWRRQLVIPNVPPCSTVDLDALLGPDQMRLPKKSSEGDMPLIAFTSGCDPAECFLRHVGIDDSEFVPPGSTTGHVHFYTGQDSTTAVLGFGGTASAVAGGNGFKDTYRWWSDPANLLAYDIVFNACECSAYDRNAYTGGGDAYQAMDAYLNAGGRLFTTHFYYNWFAPRTGTADLSSVAQWSPNGQGGSSQETDTIDMSFPKGNAFAQWLQNNGISRTLGSVDLADTRDDIAAPAPAGCGATMSCLSTQWIVHPGDNHPRYLSFNTPVSATTDKQCGRAVFSDVHLSGATNDKTFPAECATADPKMQYSVNEKALEFLFFDLSSCVQNEQAPPAPPPPPPPPPQ